MQKSIEISTTQNVTIEYPLAAVRERFLALLLDFFVIGVAEFLLMLMVFRYVISSNSMAWGIFLSLFPILLFWAYTMGFEIINRGQTLGKMAVGIKVVRLDGKEPEWGDVTMRAALHLLDTLFSFGVVGLILMKTTEKSQRLGDMAANTTVIKILGVNNHFRLADIMNIQTIDNYQPVYPQVKRLREKDMIFIKSALTRSHQYYNQAHIEVLEDLVTQLMPILGLETRPLNASEFLKTLLRDYIVLTR